MLFDPVAYGPPEPIIVPAEFVKVQLVSSRLLPLNTLMVIGPLNPPVDVALPFKLTLPPQEVMSGPASTVGKGVTNTVT